MTHRNRGAKYSRPAHGVNNKAESPVRSETEVRGPVDDPAPKSVESNVTGTSAGQVSEDPRESQSEDSTEAEEDTLELGIFKTRTVTVLTEEEDHDANTQEEEETDDWEPAFPRPEEKETIVEQFFDLKLSLNHNSAPSKYIDPDKDYQCLRKHLLSDWRMWSVLKINEYHQDFFEWVELRRGARRWERILKRANPKTWVDRRKIWNQAKRDCLAEIRREREVYFVPAARELEDQLREKTPKGQGWSGLQEHHFPIPAPGFGHMREHSRMRRVPSSKEAKSSQYPALLDVDWFP